MADKKSYGGYDPTDPDAMKKAVKRNPPQVKPSPKKVTKPSPGKAGAGSSGSSGGKKGGGSSNNGGGKAAGGKGWFDVLFGGKGKYATGNPYKNRPAGVRYELGYHTGVDFGARAGISNGDPIYFPAKSGVVVKAGNGVDGSALGKAVVVRMDNGHYVAFAHMSTVSVTKGQRIDAGTQIGRVGNSGTNSSGPHLHMELRTPGSGGRWGRGNFVDPVAFFNNQGKVPAGGGSSGSSGGGSGGGGSWGNSKASQYAAYLMGKGYTAAGAAAIVGNLMGESSLDPKADGIDSNGKRSRGLAQWNAGRGEALARFAKARGKPWTDWKVQLDFLDHELDTSYANVGKQLRTGTDVASLSRLFLQKFEVAQDRATGGPNDVQRAKNAASVFKQYTGKASDRGSAGGGGGGGSWGDDSGSPNVTYTNVDGGGYSGGGGGGGGGGFSKKQFYAELEAKFGDLDTLLRLDKEARESVGGQSLKWAIDKLVKDRITDPSIALTYLNKTGWFKKYGEDVTKKLVMEESKPEMAKREMDARIASLQGTLNANGVQLSEEELSSIARDAWLYDWTPDQMDRAVARAGSVTLGGGEWAASVEAMHQYADDFGVKFSDPMQRQFQSDFLEKRGAEGVKAMIRAQAANRYPVFAERLDAGESLRSLTDSYFQLAGEMLEVDPESLDWSDPLFSNGRAFVATNQEGKQVQKSLADFERELRADSRWLNTKNAQDDLTRGAYGMLQRFGLVS